VRRKRRGRREGKGGLPLSEILNTPLLYAGGFSSLMQTRYFFQFICSEIWIPEYCLGT